MPKKYIADPEGSSISYDDTSLLEIPPHNKTVYFAYDEEASDFFCFCWRAMRAFLPIVHSPPYNRLF